MRPLQSYLNGRLTFLQEFLKHPLQIGSVTPSSRFLEQRIVDAASIASARTIVELGAGTGGTTLAILRAMPRHAVLLSIEINPELHALVRKIRDRRLIAHLGNAGSLREIVAAHGLAPPDAVISGIPFSTMDPATGSRVVEAISSVLSPKGRFVAYQVSTRVVSLCRPVLGTEERGMELLNIPPMRIYIWTKNGS